MTLGKLGSVLALDHITPIRFGMEMRIGKHGSVMVSMSLGCVKVDTLRRNIYRIDLDLDFYHLAVSPLFYKAA